MRDKDAEAFSVLDGQRARMLKKAAVRIEDLDGLLALASKLKSTKSTGDPPTKAEYDALVEDVHALHQRLSAISSALSARLR